MWIAHRDPRGSERIFAARGGLFPRGQRDVMRQLLPPRHVVVATGGGTYRTRASG
jgi:shikimate kinase